MSRVYGLGCLLVALILLVQPAIAQTSATAKIFSAGGPTTYQYSMTLTNTGSTPIETFWFAWIPAYDFLRADPTPSVPASPAGWSVTEPQDGIFQPRWSIQWVNSTNPLLPGQSLSGFNFTSPETPATIIGGPSDLGSFYPVSTAYVYSGVGEVGTFGALTVVAPEPMSMGLIAAPVLLMLRRRR